MKFSYFRFYFLRKCELCRKEGNTWRGRSGRKQVKEGKKFVVVKGRGKASKEVQGGCTRKM